MDAELCLPGDGGGAHAQGPGNWGHVLVENRTQAALNHERLTHFMKQRNGIVYGASKIDTLA